MYPPSLSSSLFSSKQHRRVRSPRWNRSHVYRVKIIQGSQVSCRGGFDTGYHYHHHPYCNPMRCDRIFKIVVIDLESKGLEFQIPKCSKIMMINRFKIQLLYSPPIIECPSSASIVFHHIANPSRMPNRVDIPIPISRREYLRCRYRCYVLLTSG
jgi:hypothetical protein